MRLSTFAALHLFQTRSHAPTWLPRPRTRPLPQVPKGSPAEAAGLKPTTRDPFNGSLLLGDIITGLDGRKVGRGVRYRGMRCLVSCCLQTRPWLPVWASGVAASGGHCGAVLCSRSRGPIKRPSLPC